jgi:hypothetical protein
MLGAASTAENRIASLDAVADDSASAVCTFRRERVDRAFKRVKAVPAVVHDYGEHLVIFIAACFTFGHWPLHPIDFAQSFGPTR